MIEFLSLSNESDFDNIRAASHEKDQLIFKHSHRCSISVMAKSKLDEYSGDLSDLDFYLIDVVEHRELSRHIADELDIIHQSPQVLLLQNGRCVYDASHWAINMDDILAATQ